MSDLATLRGLSGLSTEPAALKGSALVMVDLQNTYREGVMRLEGVEPALREAAALLARARRGHPGLPHPARRGAGLALRCQGGHRSDQRRGRTPGRRTGNHQGLPKLVRRHRPPGATGCRRGEGPRAGGFHDAHVHQLDRARRFQSGVPAYRGGLRHGHPRPSRAGWFGRPRLAAPGGEPCHPRRPLRRGRTEAERYSRLRRPAGGWEWAALGTAVPVVPMPDRSKSRR
jgi:hypothetical protein